MTCIFEICEVEMCLRNARAVRGCENARRGSIAAAMACQVRDDDAMSGSHLILSHL